MKKININKIEVDYLDKNILATSGKILKEKLIQTTESCPSQWEGVTANGYYVYVRYRFGQLSIEIANDKEAWFENSSSFLLGGDSYFDFDGTLLNEELLEILEKLEL